MTTKSDTTSKAAANGPKTPWNGAPSFETIAQEGRASFDSVVEATSIATKGYGAIGGAWFDFAKEAMAAQAGAAEALMAPAAGPSSPTFRAGRRRPPSSARWPQASASTT